MVLQQNALEACPEGSRAIQKRYIFEHLASVPIIDAEISIREITQRA